MPDWNWALIQAAKLLPRVLEIKNGRPHAYDSDKMTMALHAATITEKGQVLMKTLRVGLAACEPRHRNIVYILMSGFAQRKINQQFGISAPRAEKTKKE